MNSRQPELTAIATDAVVERVAAEIRRLNFSMREVERRSGVSNTTLAKFFNDGRLTRKVREAFAVAFNWPADWPENPPPLPEAHRDELLTLIAELVAKVDRLADEVSALRRQAGPGS